MPLQTRDVDVPILGFTTRRTSQCFLNITDSNASQATNLDYACIWEDSEQQSVIVTYAPFKLTSHATQPVQQTGC